MQPDEKFRSTKKPPGNIEDLIEHANEILTLFIISQKIMCGKGGCPEITDILFRAYVGDEGEITELTWMAVCPKHLAEFVSLHNEFVEPEGTVLH